MRSIRFLASAFFSLITFFAFSLFTTTTAHAETISQSRATATNLGLYGGEVRDIAVDTNSDSIYITTYSPNGVYVSADNGTTWSGLPAGTDYGEPRGVEIDSAGNVYAVLGEGLIKSTDRGTNWTLLSSFPAGYGGSIAIAADDAIYIGRTDGKMSVSRNGGTSFTTTDVTGDGSVIQSIATSSTPGTVYVTTTNNTTTGLYKTVDFGSTWSLVNTSSVTTLFSTVGIDPTDSNQIILISSTADVGPWMTTNGGTSWSQLPVTPYATHVNFDSTGRIYLGVDYSDDDGATWNSVNPSTPISRVSGYVTADPDDVNTIYGGSFAAFAKSTNRGVSWTDSNQGITAVTVKDIAQSPDKNTVWVATNAGLARTTNFLSDAPTWTFPIQYDAGGFTVWLDPDDSSHVVVGGQSSVIYSNDGGATWSTATGWDSAYAALQIVHKPGNPDVLFAAASYQNSTAAMRGGVYTSTNGGVTWSSLSFPSDESVQSIAAKSDGTLYAGTGNISINATSETGMYTYNGTSWSKLTGSPAEEITAIEIDPNDSTIIYATAADFNTQGRSGEASGFYRSTDSGATWTRITSGLTNAMRFRSIGLQDAGTITNVYLGGTDKLSSAGVIYKSTNNGVDFGLYYTGLKNENFNTLLFDGLMSGNTRGLYDLKAKALITLKLDKKKVKKGGKVQAVLTLKDKSTSRVLKNKSVTIYKKKGSKWVKVKTVRTSKKGTAKISVYPTKKLQLKAVWSPKGVAAEEFAKSTSTVKTVSIKK